MFKNNIRLLTKDYITKDVVLMRFSKPAEFSFRPGQYIVMRFKDENGKTVPRQYSIASANSDENIEIIAKIIPGGFASEKFKAIKHGAEIEIMGPMGLFVLKEDANDHYFISAGTGMAPFRSMAREYVKMMTEKRFSLLSSYRTSSDIVLHDEFLELSHDNENFLYDATITREDWDGKKGRVQNHIEMKGGRVYYICGLDALISETRKLLLDKGVPEENIMIEKYD